MSDTLTTTIHTIDRLIEENTWKRPTSLRLTQQAAQALAAYYPANAADVVTAGDLIGRSYAGVPIVDVTAPEISLGFPSLDDDLDSKPMTRTCSLEEGGACESCQ
jgi:hypothetical protein